MHSIEFSTEQVQAMHKFLSALDENTFETTGLNEEEKEAVLDCFGEFVGAVEEIQIDQFHATQKENS
jgi:hypothetical protein